MFGNQGGEGMKGSMDVLISLVFYIQDGQRDL